MKGVSAVIATILLLLIVIAIVGFAFGFFQRFFGIATSQGTTQLQAQQNMTSQSLRIESIASSVYGFGSSIVVRNTGTNTISGNTITVFVNNAYASGCSFGNSIASGLLAPNTTSCGIFTCPGSTVKITIPGFGDTLSC